MLNVDQSKQWDFWIDRGGTFTDIVAKDPSGKIHTDKILSENDQLYKDAGMAGIKRFLKVPHSAKIPTDIITTKGLKDQLRIAYQNRPNLFDRKITLTDP